MAFVDLLIVALLAGLVYLVAQNRRATRTGPDPLAADPDTVRLTEEVRELRARIHVLERVITDNHGSADLSSEIDRLRDR